MKADRVLLGSPDGSGDVTTVADAFRAGGIPAEAVADIRGEVWNKLWGNSNMNTLGALGRADVLQLLDDDGVRGLVLAMMREMAGLGERIGLTGLGSPEERIAVTRRLGAFKTSMVQDLEAGRTLELGPILGALVELGARLGRPVPTLAGVYGLLRLLALNLGLGGAGERKGGAPA